MLILINVYVLICTSVYTLLSPSNIMCTKTIRTQTTVPHEKELMGLYQKLSTIETITTKTENKKYIT